MPKIDVTIISGRTAEQGVGLEEGKTSERYAKSTSLIELSPPDAEALGIDEGQAVKVTTLHGAVVVHSRKSEGLEEGLAFLPYGPWANQLFGAATYGTGARARVRAMRYILMLDGSASDTVASTSMCPPNLCARAPDDNVEEALRRMLELWPEEEGPPFITTLKREKTER